MCKEKLTNNSIPHKFWGFFLKIPDSEDLNIFYRLSFKCGAEFPIFLGNGVTGDFFIEAFDVSLTSGDTVFAGSGYVDSVS